jgi:hypothetical protein
MLGESRYQCPALFSGRLSPFAAPSSAKPSQPRLEGADTVWFFERGFEIMTCEAHKGEAAYELVAVC